MIRTKRVKVKSINGEDLNVLPAEAKILEKMKADYAEAKKSEKAKYDTKEEKSKPEYKRKPGPKPKA